MCVPPDSYDGQGTAVGKAGHRPRVSRLGKIRTMWDGSGGGTSQGSAGGMLLPTLLSSQNFPQSENCKLEPGFLDECSYICAGQRTEYIFFNTLSACFIHFPWAPHSAGQSCAREGRPETKTQLHPNLFKTRCFHLSLERGHRSWLHLSSGRRRRLSQCRQGNQPLLRGCRNMETGLRPETDGSTWRSGTAEHRGGWARCSGSSVLPC